jgi:hypothetical protein
MPNLSLTDESWQRLLASVSPLVREELTRAAEDASDASLIIRQECDKCMREDALTTYGWPRDPGRPWEMAHVCGECRTRLEANRVARLAAAAAAQIAPEAANTVMAHLLADRRYVSRYDEQTGYWWSPPQEADNPDFGQRLEEAFADEFTDQWPVIVE